MAKKRLDASKIAKQPKLKKDIAKFLAECEANWDEVKVPIVDILFRGRRGYINMNEGDLLRLFEKRHAEFERLYVEEVQKKQDEAGKYGWERTTSDRLRDI